MNRDELVATAKKMVAKGKGILAADESTSTIISACCFSLPASAPSSQSHVMSNTRPIFACSSRALPISLSLPAKCSHAGMTGKGFSPVKSASRGCGAWGSAAMGKGPEGCLF